MTPPYEDARLEEVIRSSDISDERVAAFFDDYLDSRRQCGAAEAVFQKAGALVRLPEWLDQYAIGFNVILRKGPFVEGSSWAPYHAWQFALALERNLLGKLEELLRQGPISVGQGVVSRDWSSILSAAETLSHEIGVDLSNSCVIVTGPLHEDWLIDLTRQSGVVPDWELPSELNRTWIRGSYHDALILHIDESAESTLFVVDISRFARLTEHGTPAIQVDPIDEDKAKELLANEQASGEQPQQLGDLQLKVWMRLYESWSFDLLDENASAGVELAPLANRAAAHN